MLTKIKYRIKVLKILRPFSYGVNKFLLFNGLAALISMGLGFVLPLFYKLFVDDVILGQQFSLMPLVAVGYVTIFILNMGLSYAKNYFCNRWTNRVTFRAKMKMLKGFFDREFTEYDNQSVGDMRMRIEDDTLIIADYAEKQSFGYVKAYLTMIIAVILLFLIEWRLALFSCIGIPLTLWLDHLIAGREAKILDKQRENDEKMSSWLHASVQGWREIKALNLQKHEERKFAHFIHNFAILNGMWINYWVARVLIIPKIKEEFVMRFCLYFFGGLLIMTRNFEIGSLLVFMQYYALLSGALETVSGADAELTATLPKTERLLNELNRAFEKKRGIGFPNGNGEISFENVCFMYPGSADKVVDNLSFSIRKGERVAINGRSGAGKTTTLKLMLGMLNPSSGDVKISDIPVREICQDAIFKHFGIVMQDNMLFNTSIKENLRYAKPEATESELIEVCRKVFILDFVNKLPDGLDTVIGERGIKLSGGQKQRIVLARLILRDVDVLIFDEATSALDQYSESLVQDAIKSISSDKTVIIVAHRKNSLKLCDRVVELKAQELSC